MSEQASTTGEEAPKYSRKNPPVVTFTVRPYMLQAVPGRYFMQRSGNFVASVRKADYKATVEGVVINVPTKAEAKSVARQVLRREIGWAGPVNFEFKEI